VLISPFWPSPVRQFVMEYDSSGELLNLSCVHPFSTWMYTTLNTCSKFSHSLHFTSGLDFIEVTSIAELSLFKKLFSNRDFSATPLLNYILNSVVVSQAFQYVQPLWLQLFSCTSTCLAALLGSHYT
jgi:hypothetical protein